MPDPVRGDDLALMSASEALARFRTRELSPVELIDAVLARADLIQEPVNPFTARYDDDARSAARAAEKRYAEGSAGALDGLPVAIKELTAVAGQQHTLASLLLEHNVATESAPISERILAAGGIVHARTTTPEFGCASFTESRLYGLTRNPWDLDLSPAGSSGGSAAALATGAATLATGTDSAGSLRLPAAACGVVGLKPSFGRVPSPPPFGFEQANHDGPMARTVTDLALLLNVIAGPHPAAPNSLPAAPPVPLEPQGVEGLRLAVLTGIDGLAIDPDVAANASRAVDALRAAGAEAAEVDLGWSFDAIFEATKLHFAAQYGPAIQRFVDEAPELVTPFPVRFAEEMAEYARKPGFVLRARELTAELWAPLGRVLAEHDVLVYPTLAMPAPPAGEQFLDRGPVVNGVEQGDRWIVGTTVAFNLCSWCPVVSVPSGLSAGGVPTGVQFAGRPYDEPTVLRAARALERERPWHHARPRLLDERQEAAPT
jgi:Asp-tRNA(Asn)/Glu-tRNA(Gln) amidotransferase A subunit family amidase